MDNMITTIDWGNVPIRRTHTVGKIMDLIELSNDEYAEIRKDYDTCQPFAVVLD